MSLQIIQQRLKAPKSQFNAFGKYNYRNLEDIQEAAKPLLAEFEYSLVLADKIKEIGGRVYVEATATIYDKDMKIVISNEASAREALTKKGMDESQITGACSSYARKYALNGLFAIDDTKDADSMDNKKDEPPAPKKITKSDFQAKIDAKTTLQEVEEWERCHLGKAEAMLSAPDYEWFTRYIADHKTTLAE